jgi:hypothetical protein
MDASVKSPVRVRGGWPGVACAALATALAATLAAANGVAAQTAAEGTLNAAVKAAFLFNFAKFTEWPALLPGAPIVFCIVDDETIAAALVETMRGQNIGGHPLEVSRPPDIVAWRLCHLLFIANAATERFPEGLNGVRTLPVLTVSDARGFVPAGGIIELYLEGGRTRFAIDVDAAGRSGLRLSSRLLGLAKVVREGR